jgi:hypothetical protein
MILMPDDLLLDFEKRALEGGYRKYFEIKRNNFFATISHLPRIWASFMALDEVWMREFEDLYHPRDMGVVLPVILFMNAHAHLRIAMELGFSGAMNECWNTLRMGIESVHHACVLLADPSLTVAWAEKANTTAEAERAFERAFEEGKTKSYERLGLSKLHEFWINFSEWSHTSIESLSRRIKLKEKEGGLDYLETDSQILALSLMRLLSGAHEMEKVLFTRFADRLRLDPALVEKRSRFESTAEAARRDTIERFKIPRPRLL